MMVKTKMDKKFKRTILDNVGKTKHGMKMETKEITRNDGENEKE